MKVVVKNKEVEVNQIYINNDFLSITLAEINGSYTITRFYEGEEIVLAYICPPCKLKLPSEQQAILKSLYKLAIEKESSAINVMIDYTILKEEGISRKVLDELWSKFLVGGYPAGSDIKAESYWLTEDGYKYLQCNELIENDK